MFVTGTALVNQDEKEIFTLHTMMPSDVSDPLKVLHEKLGGIGAPVPVKVEEILTTGSWKSSLSVADSFRSAGGRVFLAGDAGMLGREVLCP